MELKITPPYPRHTEEPDRGLAQRTALIVDDEEPIRYMLSRVLAGLGYVCTAAANGKEALEKTARLEFDLMLLDVKMPGTSGLEVLRHFRAHNDETCVVMLSALVDKEVFVEALRHGADDYLVKPCRPELLQEKLQRAHERRLLALQAEVDPKERTAQLREITAELIGPNDVNGEWPTSSTGPIDSVPEQTPVRGGAHSAHSEEVSVCAHCGQRAQLLCGSCQTRLGPGVRSRDKCDTAGIALAPNGTETLVS